MIQKSVGDRIRELRNQKKLSQEKLALLVDLDRTYSASLEKGRRNISIGSLEKILCGLDISFKDFFTSDLFEDNNK